MEASCSARHTHSCQQHSNPDQYTKSLCMQQCVRKQDALQQQQQQQQQEHEQHQHRHRHLEQDDCTYHALDQQPRKQQLLHHVQAHTASQCSTQLQQWQGLQPQHNQTRQLHERTQQHQPQPKCQHEYQQQGPEPSLRQKQLLLEHLHPTNTAQQIPGHAQQQRWQQQCQQQHRQQQQQLEHVQQQHQQQHMQQHSRPNEQQGAPAPEFPAPQPLVFAVGHLGPKYWEWVDRPVPGRPRFFRSSFLEHCSKTVWWVVPALWLPIWAAITAAAAAAATAPTAAAAPAAGAAAGYVERGYGACEAPNGSSLLAMLAAQQLCGVVLWQGLEYAIHRFLFHRRPCSYWGITLHFLFHGCHHKFPMDPERLVFPPVPAAPIVAAIYGLLRLLLARQAALGVMAGVLLGYVAYDCLHYAIHHRGGKLARWPLLRELWARHNHHHYRDHDAGFGISSVAFDVLLRTSAALASARPS